MYLADYHTHSVCSPDGSAPLTEMARAAINAGLSELCLTDHCDFIDYDGQPDDSFRWAPVEEQIREAAPLCSGRLVLKLGLELGEAWENPALAETIYHHPGVDFVLASIHNLPLADGGQDIYSIRYRSEAICFSVLDQYFRVMEGLARLSCYDVLAHLIYPLRYMNIRDGNAVTLERYRDILSEIFHVIVPRGKGIELNTCRGSTVEDWRWVLRLYREHGGEIVTLGSDAHSPRHVGAGVRQGMKLLKELGFTYFATYNRHTPVLREL